MKDYDGASASDGSLCRRQFLAILVSGQLRKHSKFISARRSTYIKWYPAPQLTTTELSALKVMLPLVCFAGNRPLTKVGRGEVGGGAAGVERKKRIRHNYVLLARLEEVSLFMRRDLFGKSQMAQNWMVRKEKIGAHYITWVNGWRRGNREENFYLSDLLGGELLWLRRLAHDTHLAFEHLVSTSWIATQRLPCTSVSQQAECMRRRLGHQRRNATVQQQLLHSGHSQMAHAHLHPDEGMHAGDRVLVWSLAIYLATLHGSGLLQSLPDPAPALIMEIYPLRFIWQRAHARLRKDYDARGSRFKAWAMRLTCTDSTAPGGQAEHKRLRPSLLRLVVDRALSALSELSDQYGSNVLLTLRPLRLISDCVRNAQPGASTESATIELAYHAQEAARRQRAANELLLGNPDFDWATHTQRMQSRVVSPTLSERQEEAANEVLEAAAAAVAVAAPVVIIPVDESAGGELAAEAARTRNIAQLRFAYARRVGATDAHTPRVSLLHSDSVDSADSWEMPRLSAGSSSASSSAPSALGATVAGASSGESSDGASTVSTLEPLSSDEEEMTLQQARDGKRKRVSGATEGRPYRKHKRE